MKRLKLLSIFMLVASSATIIAENAKELNALDGYYIYLYVLVWAILTCGGFFLQKYVFKNEDIAEKAKPDIYEKV